MKKAIAWLIVLVVVLGAAVVLFFWFKAQTPEPEVLESPTPTAEPAIRHPIEEARPAEEPPVALTKPLPVLADSDGAIRNALVELFGRRLEKFFNLNNIVHRFVATVDNLPRDHLPQRLMPIKPVAGIPVTTGKGDSLSLSPKNASRYLPYVKLVEAVPTGALVAVYVRFYPLLQQQYEQLGYLGKYFNDRLVQVIDHLLETPEVKEPVRFIQPRVLYEFTDPKLERLSAGQKIVVRMGGENAAKIKAKLLAIRSALVPKTPKG